MLLRQNTCFRLYFIHRASITQYDLGLKAAKGRKEDRMLWTIVVVLLILWLLGLVTSYTLGGLVHLLLIIAIIMVIVNLISGRRPL